MNKEQIADRLDQLGHAYIFRNHQLNKIKVNMQAHLDQGVDIPEVMEHKYEELVVFVRALQLEMETLEIKLSEMR